ncbi:hypothetical protein [Geodermatophilus sp. SYSU D00684]
MSLPLLVAVDDDPALLADVHRELHNRFSVDYRISCPTSAREGRTTLQACAAAGEDVALVLAAEQLEGASGTDLLAEVPALFPDAVRGLLIGWDHLGDPATGDAVFEAIARGRMDQYLVRLPRRGPCRTGPARAGGGHSGQRGPGRGRVPTSLSRLSAHDARRAAFRRTAECLARRAAALPPQR